jgi:ABC-type phosphate transport system substrate-binding protein
MSSRKRRLRVLAVALAALTLAAPGLLTGSAAVAAVSHAEIDGSGSSWAANAVNQWTSDVSSSGLTVVFTGSGSAIGRTEFANGTTDFAVSDIGYQGNDPKTGAEDSNCVGGSCRAFAYEPIVAGGTAFPYQVRVGGKLVTNLRLSGLTLTKIFTHQITNWNDPAITADNNGRVLPSLKIITVVHSEGSGSTAQFTQYMATEYPSLWTPFNSDPHFTEYYPNQDNKSIAQNGSDGVMNYVASAAANGAIGYDEYSYPLLKNWPAAKLLNKAGYYTLPDQYNVAVALQHAVINMDKSSPNYLLQTLDKVYVAPEVQAYPMSSYSYFLIPTGANDSRMKTDKRQTLADFLYYAVCQGQKEMGPIGYSPLPINLVTASFAQTALLQAADPKVDLNKRNVNTCNNPTFVAGHPEINHLAKIAPVPPACDKQGQGPCGVVATTTGASHPTTTSSGGASSGGNGTGGQPTGGATGIVAPTPGVTNAPTGVAASGGGQGPVGGGSTDAGAATDPNAGSGDAVQAAQAIPTDIPQFRPQGMTHVLAPLAVLELLAVLAVPPLFYYFVLRRRRVTR